MVASLRSLLSSVYGDVDYADDVDADADVDTIGYDGGDSDDDANSCYDGDHTDDTDDGTVSDIVAVRYFGFNDEGDAAAGGG